MSEAIETQSSNSDLLTAEQQSAIEDMLAHGPLLIDFNLNDVFAPGADGFDIPNMETLKIIAGLWAEGGHSKVIEYIEMIGG